MANRDSLYMHNIYTIKLASNISWYSGPIILWKKAITLTSLPCLLDNDVFLFQEFCIINDITIPRIPMDYHYAFSIYVLILSH